MKIKTIDLDGKEALLVLLTAVFVCFTLRHTVIRENDRDGFEAVIHTITSESDVMSVFADKSYGENV